MEPKVFIQGSERSRCCLTAPEDDISVRQVDICGRINCLWPCPRTNSSATGNVVDVDVTGDKAFFHETSGARSINYRQACAVESLAHLNPVIFYLI